MIQTIKPNHVITIEIQEYLDENLPGDEKYIAWIKEPEYKGIIVTAYSIDECLKELSISLKVLNLYRKNIQ